MEEFPQNNPEKEPPIQKHKKWMEKMKLAGEVVLGFSVTIIGVNYIMEEVLKWPIDAQIIGGQVIGLSYIWGGHIIKRLKEINEKYKD